MACMSTAGCVQPCFLHFERQFKAIPSCAMDVLCSTALPCFPQAQRKAVRRENCAQCACLHIHTHCFLADFLLHGCFKRGHDGALGFFPHHLMSDREKAMHGPNLRGTEHLSQGVGSPWPPVTSVPLQRRSNAQNCVWSAHR